MTVDIKTTITGLQEAQAANIRRIAVLQPGGGIEQPIRAITVFTHAEAVKVTHVDTGALRASHRMQVQAATGEVFIDPGATNPRSGRRVLEYAGEEHARGGDHAFYRIAAQQALKFAFNQMVTWLRQRVTN